MQSQRQFGGASRCGRTSEIRSVFSLLPEIDGAWDFNDDLNQEEQMIEINKGKFYFVLLYEFCQWVLLEFFFFVILHTYLLTVVLTCTNIN